MARPDAAPTARAQTETIAVDCRTIIKTFGAGAVRALDGVSLAIRTKRSAKPSSGDHSKEL